MNFRKIAALLFSASMLVAAISGCTTKESTTKQDSTTAGEETTTDASNEDPTTEGDNIPVIDPSTVAPYNPDTAITEGYGLTENLEDGTILHCFCWSFETITNSMADIAMAGYTSIQTSPINVCNDGGDAGMDLYGSGKWYYHYQPTDWKIGNYQLGTEAEFKKMCAKAEEYGINVIVDVVPNHTTTNTSAISQDFINAVGGITKLYHSNGKTDISNYGDRGQCTLQAMGGLPDVDTENPLFQDYFLSFLNTCIAYGVDGFRYDTAKHIGLSDDPKDSDGEENNFWTKVTTEITNADKIFNYGEVLQGDNERITDYNKVIGATTASNYGFSLRSALLNRNFTASNVSNMGVSGTTNLVTWVESHDNYTGDDATYKNYDNTAITLGWAIIAGRGEGTPLFFSRPYGATKDNMWGTFNKIGIQGDNLYKDPTIVAINRFRNAMAGESEKFFNPGDSKTVLFIERGEKGLLIASISKKEQTFSTETALADGKYLDRVSGNAYEVKDGVITGKIAPESVVILYNDNFVVLKDAAFVKVADSTTTAINGESLDVTLEAKNVVSATYSIDGGEEIPFVNGEVIKIGKDIAVLETTTLILKATNEDGNTTWVKYIFKKTDTITVGTTISFKKPAGWGDTINAYVYDETTYSEVVNNGQWPGVPMTDNGDGTYTYTFTDEWIAPLVIFNDGTNQSNAPMEPGAEVVPGKLYEVK